ncbi:hypothetical protein ACROYT_G021963 [Oculina patagonica]
MLVKIFVILAISLLETSQVSSVPDKSCGIRNPLPSKLFRRIVGGAIAKHDSWPWQVELLRVKKNTTTYTHRCGGTLIDDEWVVTTAACVFMFPYPSHYKVVLGQIKRTEVTGAIQNEHIYDISCIRIHEKYWTRGYGFDIALLKLARPAIYEPGKVWPACLPSQGQRVAIGTECFFTGWGKTSSNSTFSDVLREAKMPVVDNETCAAGNVDLFAAVDDETMVCAGYGGNSVISGCHDDITVCRRHGMQGSPGSLWKVGFERVLRKFLDCKLPEVKLPQELQALHPGVNRQMAKVAGRKR